MRVQVIAKTKKGEKALQQHMAESLTMGKLRKIYLNRMGISQSVVGNNPYIVEMIFKGTLGSLMKEDHVKAEIIEAMTTNGARLTDDYIVEIL